MTSKVQQNVKLLKVISFSYFIVFLGHSLWRSTFYNYSLEVIELTQTEISWVFSIASIPGIFAFLLGYVVHKIPVYFLASTTLFILSAGLFTLGEDTDYNGLLQGIFMLSFGFAWYLPLANNISIHESRHGSVNRKLGRLKSMGPLASSLIAIIILFYNEEKQIETLFFLSGLILLLTGFMVGKSLQATNYGRKQVYLFSLRRLWPFYLLNFISGSRSALFKTFIMTQFIFASHLSVVEMSNLLLIGSITGVCGYWLIGFLADKFQPENVLTALYIIIAGVFAGFIYVQMNTPFGLIFALILFLVDSLLFGSTVITDAYLKLACKDDYLVSNLASGTSFFHLAGVFLPLAGNFVWMHFGGLDAVLILGIIVSMFGALISRFMSVFSRLLIADRECIRGADSNL